MDGLVINHATQKVLEKTILHMPQALLLRGKKGVGVGQIAVAIAKRQGTILETVYPKKRHTNGSYVVDIESGTIIIDDIRSLYERTRSKFTSPQVIIIDLGDRPMSTSAQNAFLKLLEEPQRHIHFIIATHHLTQLLPTVLSRCQRIDIKPINDEQTTQLLDTLNVTDPTIRARIVFIASGLPEEITRLTTDTNYYEARIKTVQDARTILEGDSYTRLRAVQTYKDKRTTTLQLIDDMMRQLQLSAAKSPNNATLRQLESLVRAYERIQANGNIQLNLASVLL